MSKFLALTLATVVVALVIGGAGSSSGGPPPRDLVTVDTTVKDLDIDVDNSNDLTIGDQFIDVDILKNAAGTRTIGRIDAIYTFTDVSEESPTVHVEATATLPGGTVELAGLFVLGPLTGRIAITGGTGAYRSARGELRTSVINDTDVRVVFDFDHGA
jgi:hypothetical protein